MVTATPRREVRILRSIRQIANFAWHSLPKLGVWNGIGGESEADAEGGWGFSKLPAWRCLLWASDGYSTRRGNFPADSLQMK